MNKYDSLRRHLLSVVMTGLNLSRAQCFTRTSLWENCLLLRTDNYSFADKYPRGPQRITCRHSPRVSFNTYLTIILRARVEYEMIDSHEVRSAELAIIISYPTSASGLIPLLR